MLAPITINDLNDFGAHKGVAVAETGFNGTQTANHANSTSPTSATLSNTAAGYTTLGGRYQFAMVGGAATDYALFAYQVPATARLVVKGIAISLVNTGAANATTASVFDWGIAVNSTAVSLATTDSGAVYGPRRRPLGTQALLITDAIGVVAPDIIRQLQEPMIVQPSRYLHVILQIPVGTATGSQVIRGDVMIDGKLEPLTNV